MNCFKGSEVSDVHEASKRTLLWRWCPDRRVTAGSGASVWVLSTRGVVPGEGRGVPSLEKLCPFPSGEVRQAVGCAAWSPREEKDPWEPGLQRVLKGLADSLRVGGTETRRGEASGGSDP